MEKSVVADHSNGAVAGKTDVTASCWLE